MNSLPEDVLRQLNWDDDAINSLVSNKKQTPISKAALNKLGITENSVKNPTKGLYFGKGSFGKVKFAQIIDPASGQKQSCVAKKIKPHNPDNIKEIKELSEQLQQEVALQQQAGSVAPKTYGFAETVDKNGDPEFMVFMEQAQGMDGWSFLIENGMSEKLSPGETVQFMRQLTSTVSTLHENGVYHTDLKWENSRIDPDNGNIQLLDFGLATNEEETPVSFDKAPGYMAPEAVLDGTKSAAKMDVFSLGVMLIDLVKTDDKSNPFDTTEWSYKESEARVAGKIKKNLSNIQFPNKPTENLITRMLHPDPNKRPGIKEVHGQLKTLSLY